MIEQDEQQQQQQQDSSYAPEHPQEPQQQHPSLISRIGSWFKRGGAASGTTAVTGAHADATP